MTDERIERTDQEPECTDWHTGPDLGEAYGKALDAWLLKQPPYEGQPAFRESFRGEENNQQ
jgi:hypothetical protein